jgi:diguanylate cyclase (GGDEF)-like protein
VKNNYIHSRTSRKPAIVIGILLCILFWIIETVLEVMIFKIESGDIIERLFFPNFHELWMRSSLVAMTMLLVFYIYHVKELKQIEDKLKKAAITDDLTGLLNRRGFFVLAEHQCKLATRIKKIMALLYLDLDGLKVINDELGHEAGDQALMDISNIFKTTFRSSDIIARIGGDEFVVLLDELPKPNDESTIISHLQDNLKKHNELGIRNYELSISIGVAYYDGEHPCDISKLLQQADEAMYKNKNH